MRTIWGEDFDAGAAIKWSGAYKIYDSNGNALAPDNYPARKAFLEQRAIGEEVIVETRNGERRHVTCYLQPLFSADGSCSGTMNLVADITDRKLSEQKLAGLMSDLENRVEQRTMQLKQANDHLTRANYDLEQYAFIASHDLQEPLRKIRMFVDLASRNRHDVQRLSLYLNKIDASATKMSTLVKDVLNYSMLLMNASEFVQVDLNDIASKTLAELASQIFIKNAKVTVGSLPVVPGVHSQLLLLFNNIVLNSLTFTDVSPQIVISADEVDGAQISQLGADTRQRYARIEFKDNGIGFDETYKDRIFDIFERLNTWGSHTGNGMGLPLCKRVVENHHGFITATSKRGSGSTFEVYLPSLKINPLSRDSGFVPEPGSSNAEGG
ncbi:MAG TPA: ATP-binding protein [Chryseosolibacter sp.]|nr:ATP-binding protein [Chryseosolibacter sp.]